MPTAKPFPRARPRESTMALTRTRNQRRQHRRQRTKPDRGALLRALTTSTPRVHRYRQRRRNGTVLLRNHEIEPLWTCELVDRGLLKECDVENPAKIEEAIKKLFTDLILKRRYEALKKTMV